MVHIGVGCGYEKDESQNHASHDEENLLSPIHLEAAATASSLISSLTAFMAVLRAAVAGTEGRAA